MNISKILTWKLELQLANCKTFLLTGCSPVLPKAGLNFSFLTVSECENLQQN